MPIFTEIATGRTVDAAVASLPDGNPKPGYRAQLGPGEYAHFDITMRDAAPGRSDASNPADLADAAWQKANDDLNAAALLVFVRRDFTHESGDVIGRRGLRQLDVAGLIGHAASPPAGSSPA